MGATIYTMKSPIAQFRKDQNLTLEACGERFGVNKSTVLRWERDGIPIERVIETERLTGIPRAKLRPDLFGDAA